MELDERHKKWIENQPQLPYRGDITKEELAKHNTRDDCWCSYEGYVYDMTPYLDIHPGGPTMIFPFGGEDMTAQYKSRHAWVPISILDKVKIGKLVD